MLLALAGELLAASIDYETTLETVARVALPALADYAFFDVLEGGSGRRLARAARDGVQPEAEAMLASLGETPGPPAAEARLGLQRAAAEAGWRHAAGAAVGGPISG